MKKIGMDFTYIEDDSITGIRKYGEEILTALSNINDKYEIILFVNKELDKVFKNNFPQYKRIPIKTPFKNLKKLRRINSITLAKLYKNMKIRQEKCDVLIHVFTDIKTPLLGKKKEISSIPDIIRLDILSNQKSLKYKITKRMYKKMMNKTKFIITISNYSKDRMMAINKNYKGIIAVIPNIIEKPKKTNKNPKEILGNEKPYILSINSFERHKNQITLVKAFNLIKDRVSHNLVLLGRSEADLPISAYNDVVKYINENGLNDRIVILSNLNDEDRNTLLYGADLFVSNSTQEGFGRTPVEAAMCKIPVISTKETALPEATLNLVNYYENALDYNELADKILSVLKNKDSKQELENIAQKLEKEYSAENVAKNYIDFIEQVISE